MDIKLRSYMGTGTISPMKRKGLISFFGLVLQCFLIASILCLRLQDVAHEGNVAGSIVGDFEILVKQLSVS